MQVRGRRRRRRGTMAGMPKNSTASAARGTRGPDRWLVLLPQLATGQSSLRVRLWRRLRQLGAIGLKGGAHVLPDTPACLESLQWLAQELQESGAEASIARCEFLQGVDAAALEQQFIRASEAEYAEIAREARQGARKRDRSLIAVRLQRQLQQAKVRDHFGVDAGHEAAQAVDALIAPAAEAAASPPSAPLPPAGTKWVTRRGVKVDRIASAWLIRRFVDPDARFRFVDPERTRLRRGEVRFDMVDAEFGHQNGRCTFEVLLLAIGNDSPALRRIADMVHELDIGNERHPHPETPGLQALIDGVIATERDDAQRIERAVPLLDGLLAGMQARLQYG